MVGVAVASEAVSVAATCAAAGAGRSTVGFVGTAQVHVEVVGCMLSTAPSHVCYFWQQELCHCMIDEAYCHFIIYEAYCHFCQRGPCCTCKCRQWPGSTVVRITSRA
jgi:hypothetical protein